MHCKHVYVRVRSTTVEVYHTRLLSVRKKRKTNLRTKKKTKQNNDQTITISL